MDFASSTRAAENRTRWKEIVVIHLWCPDDLPRLWDRIENKAVDLDWIYDHACRLSQNIYVIIKLFITNNYLFEIIRKIIFTNLFSEFLNQVTIKFRF